MFFKKREQILKQKEENILVKEKQLDRCLQELQDSNKAQQELMNMVSYLGEELSHKSFITYMILTLSAKIGGVDLSLQVSMDPSKLLKKPPENK